MQKPAGPRFRGDRLTPPLLDGRRDATRTQALKPGRSSSSSTDAPARALSSAGGRGDAEGADEPSRRHVHPQTWCSRDAASNGGRGRRASAPPAAPPSSPPASRVGAGCEGVGEGPARPGVPASVSLPPPPRAPRPGPPPACSHAASRCRSPAELITTSTYRSLARCQAGRLGARGGCGAPGRAEPSCWGRGTPSPWLHPRHRSERGLRLGLGWGGSEARLPEVGESVGLRAKGALPSRPHPLLLIKAENKEAAGEGGFDLTPPSQF